MKDFLRDLDSWYINKPPILNKEHKRIDNIEEESTAIISPYETFRLQVLSSQWH